MSYVQLKINGVNRKSEVKTFRCRCTSGPHNPIARYVWQITGPPVFRPLLRTHVPITWAAEKLQTSPTNRFSCENMSPSGEADGLQVRGGCYWTQLLSPLDLETVRHAAHVTVQHVKRIRLGRNRLFAQIWPCRQIWPPTNLKPTNPPGLWLLAASPNPLLVNRSTIPLFVVKQQTQITFTLARKQESRPPQLTWLRL